MIKRSVLSIVLIAAVLAGAYFYLRTATWYPVARLAAPEGYTVTVIQAPVANRERCEAVNLAFMTPLKKSCPQCRFEPPRCDGSLSGVEKALLSGEPLADFSVSAAGIRMLITGPASAAKPACEQIAVDMVRSGVQYAACANPGTRR